METHRLISPEFWDSAGIHVAVAPDHGAEPARLQEFARNELGASGWCFFQTSGSEGQPKWVGLTKQSILASARAVNTHFSITGSDHWLLALPVWHVGGFGILARSFLSGSAVSRLESRWSAQAFVECCAAAQATLVSLVPAQVFDLVSARLPCPPSLRVVLVGGGALSLEIAESARHLGWPVCRTYGMTETASQVASQTAGSDEMEVLPLWHLSTDTHGVLSIRGAALAQGHALRDEAGRWKWQPISPETGLRTRDRVILGCHDGRQWLRFVGREAGIVKILGELVALGPIQERLDALRLELGLHAGDAAVCDVPDARREHALVLAVSRMNETDAARLQQRLNATLRPFEHIGQLRELGSLPRSELGKVRLAELRALL